MFRRSTIYADYKNGFDSAVVLSQFEEPGTIDLILENH